MKRIFYFNITYTCNSNCVFCYSYNTIHSGKNFHEIDVDDIISYLKEENLSFSDRVIINGGEPFLHSQILPILESLNSFGCEVLIYTNGRLLDKVNFDFVDSNYRFIIPVHGYRELHDRITKSSGSFNEMALGIDNLNKYGCLVDIKVILNYDMVISDEEFERTINAIDSLNFNNAIHITQMAETVISRKNNYPSIPMNLAAKYTEVLFSYFKDKQYIIKIFDTCISNITIDNYIDTPHSLRVFFKDFKDQWELELKTPALACRSNCKLSNYCASAVGDYLVLEYNNGFRKGIE